jgi:hypothetical protein
MFVPEPEILLLRRIFNRVFDRLEGKLDSLTKKCDDQEVAMSYLFQRMDSLEGATKNRWDRDDEIEHLVNPYSPDGDPICNYHTNRLYEDDEV